MVKYYSRPYYSVSYSACLISATANRRTGQQSGQLGGLSEKSAADFLDS